MEWLSVTEVAARLGVHRKTVLSIIHSGALKAKNVSSKMKRPLWKIHVQWLEEFRENVPNEAK